MSQDRDNTARQRGTEDQNSNLYVRRAIPALANKRRKAKQKLIATTSNSKLGATSSKERTSQNLIATKMLPVVHLSFASTHKEPGVRCLPSRAKRILAQSPFTSRRIKKTVQSDRNYLLLSSSRKQDAFKRRFATGKQTERVRSCAEPVHDADEANAPSFSCQSAPEANADFRHCQRLSPKTPRAFSTPMGRLAHGAWLSLNCGISAAIWLLQGVLRSSPRARHTYRCSERMFCRVD